MDILIGLFALLFFGGLVIIPLVAILYVSTGHGRQDSDEEDWY